MGEILFTIVTFLVAISTLIAVHEFGHFWVAKKLGVKVLKYSIGFGKPIWKKTAGPDQTEYIIAALPLGGYVKMLDEREGEVDEKERHRAFNRQHVWKRFAIVFAGPAFNFVFAILAYWLVIVLGVTGFTPIVGEVYKDSPAEIAGLRTGMEIVSVGDVSTPIWETVFQESLVKLVDKDILVVGVKGNYGDIKKYRLDVSGFDLDRDIKHLFKSLGFQPHKIPMVPKIKEVLSGDPAGKAGMMPGDLITQIDDVKITDWRDVALTIRGKPAQDISVVVKRDGEYRTFNFKTKSVKQGDRLIGLAGIKPVAIDEKYEATYKLGVISAISYSTRLTWDMSALTLKMLGKMIIGEVSVKNISGPLSIADAVGKSANLGLVYFLKILAIVSISLGVLNLLPVPVLDGGHLMFYIVEIIKGSPVSDAVEAAGQRIGIMLLLMLMVFALYNDIMRFI